MITFATFMIHNIFCKINEFHAKFVVGRNNLFTELRQNGADPFKIIAEFGEYSPIVHETISCYSKAEKKLPSWFQHQCILPRIPFEQSSSELAAHFRACMTSACNVLSITGGLGVDDVAFAKVGSNVISLDTDECLNAVVDYNLQRLNISGIERLTTNANDFLEKNDETFDLIYADPDRRSKGERITGNVAEYSPDIISILKKHHAQTKRWLIKLSPMVDIEWFKQVIEQKADVYIVSVHNEVKELLFDISENSQNHNFVVQIDNTGFAVWDGDADCLIDGNISGDFFCEPKAGVIKSGLHRKMKENLLFKSENVSRTFYTCSQKPDTDFVRVFDIVAYWELGLKQVSEKLKELHINKANITCRDYPLLPDEVRKKLKISDGGDYYLFLTNDKGIKKTWLSKKAL